MARLSREKKRDKKQAASAATPIPAPAAPVDVRVPGAGTGPDGASVAGVPVVAAPGEEIQQAVLNRLHRIALAAGHPVLATVHDERIGYVVPLQVDPDGSSHFTSEPVRTAPTPTEPAPAPHPPADPPAPPAAQSSRVQSDQPTHLLRPVTGDEPVRDAGSTFPMRAVSESPSAGEFAPTFELRGVSQPVDATPPGTVKPPTGEFGPPPSMDARPVPTPGPDRTPAPPFAPGSGPAPEPPSAPGRDRTPRSPFDAEPLPTPQPAFRPSPDRTPAPPFDAEPDLGPAPDLDPKPTPVRGFDAVAEAVLGDEPLTAPGDPTTPALLAEPLARINAAVKEGRTETAARLVQESVAEAAGTLGPEHPEVLRLRELGAYIAYLAGDPGRAFRLSLDLAGIHHRRGDAEAAYGNVLSAATAWRAVREPSLGLELGGELIGLWTGLTAEDGPAAEDIEQLESARARMGRLTERARAQGN